MFINDIPNRAQIPQISTKQLGFLSIKFKVKNLEILTNENTEPSTKFFNVPLHQLESQVVAKNGQNLLVPKLLHEMCTLILTQASVEGIFRKEGSKSRQRQIMSLLELGEFPQNSDVLDTAVIVKTFFRKLPNALIPKRYHKLFLKCFEAENPAEALALAYLTLPNLNLNTLSYLMQFLNEVSSKSSTNKMTAHNLAVVVGPNLFPNKMSAGSKAYAEFMKSLSLVEYMINNSNKIGIVPQKVLDSPPEEPKLENKFISIIRRFFKCGN